jgi:hypothetical protein
MATEQEVREVKQRHSARLMSRAGVSGVGIEKDESGDFVLTVHLDAEDKKAREDLPEEIEGHRVRYVGSGPFRKQEGGSAKASASRKAPASAKASASKKR